ncbi:Predicted PurR-regulated permease PerM [Pedobacter steynii]|jgi:predicted PurR-regulated permease PerM|uniref:Predicted PurR-regulated permease PerM n=1 Tax=Pedobacter steynii TaxID=430522 RepID=A0A1H0DUV9_9SPHI|nr:AI-2E family transporter [Pedobacter steynii]NQX41845.1 AI-2E family transporter [Pedobacter steynii]SDN74037.1 Predicted PurR-regulated permease PerM [Pedobacter steynii]
MSLFNYKQRNNITLLIIIVLGCLIAYSLQGIFSAILGTLVLYTILRPAFLYLVEERKWNKRLSALLLLFVSVLVIILPFYAVSTMVIEKIAELQSDHIYFKNLIFKVKHLVPVGSDFQSLVEDGLKKAGTWATELFPSLISGAFNIVLGLLIMYFLLYFMLIENETFERSLLKYAPFREQNAYRFAEEMRNTTYANVLGQGLICVVQGSLVSLSFYVLGYSDPLFWGVMTTFISFVPVLGPPVVFVPAALLQMANGNSFGAWAMLIFGFVVIINIDNVLRFMIAKKVGNIHPIITVIGVVIGIPLFGILGLVFGPLLLSYFILLIKIYETSAMASERLERIKTISEQESL